MPFRLTGVLMPTTTHLVGAYGLHWAKSEVDWPAGDRRPWQMLGRIGQRRPGLRICDFRRAAGVYVLERRGRPIYAGLARGSEGFGARMVRHTKDDVKTWTHLSWFSFDDVLLDERRKTYPEYPTGWASVEFRHDLARAQMKSVVGELEAILVNLLYDSRVLVNIQRPRFSEAQQWEQVTRKNFQSPGICHRAAPDWFARPELLK